MFRRDYLLASGDGEISVPLVFGWKLLLAAAHDSPSTRRPLRKCRRVACGRDVPSLHDLFGFVATQRNAEAGAAKTGALG